MSGKQARLAGVLAQPPLPITFAKWQRDMCDGWFASDAAFLTYIVQRQLVLPQHLTDTLVLRAAAVFAKYGVASAPCRCSQCGSNLHLKVTATAEGTKALFMCASNGKRHPHPYLNSHGFLKRVPVASWMPFLHFFNALRVGTMSFKGITENFQVLYGNISRNTLHDWRVIYQSALGIALDLSGARVLGTAEATVVFDETVVGVHKEDGWSFESKGISKRGARQSRTTPRRTATLVKKGILKRLPARTVYNTQRVSASSHKLIMKKPSSSCVTVKKPAGAVIKKPAANMKNNGKWFWIAVEVGKGNTVFTHSGKTKRITYRILPRAADAQEHKPRGVGEISDTLTALVSKKALLVHDGWTSSVQAVRELGYRSAPPVIHELCYRDNATGFHTNDAESENARLKGWSRQRYGRIQLNKDEMDEYMSYVNLGDSASIVLKGLALSNGAAVRNRPIA